MLKEDLDLKRPVMYSGDRYDETGRHGHTFVCDGYNDRNEFHFNFGLPFAYNTSEFFTIVNLVPNQGMHYIHNHSAVFHIYPNYQHDYCEYNLHLEDYYDEFYETHHTSDYPPYNIVPTTMAQLTSASLESRHIFRTIQTGETATYQAHKEILLRDGFTVEAGADFTAQIVPCPNCETRGTELMTENEVTSPDTEEDNVEETLYARPMFMEPLADLYPNPTSGKLTMAVMGEVQDIVIYNTMGQPVGGWNLQAVADNEYITLDVSPLPTGTYLLTVRTVDDKIHTGRFVKQ